MSIQDYQDMYLDWVNNFLTIGRFTEYYEISEEKAEHIINAGRLLHELYVKVEKQNAN